MAKSIEVQIGADTKSFINEMQKADKAINTTAKTADYLSKSLNDKFSDNKFVNAQRKYQEALAKTEESMQAVREKMKKMETDGKVDTADYRALELVLAKLEAKFDSLTKRAEELDKVKANNIAVEIKEVGEQAERTTKKIEILKEKFSPESLKSTGAQFSNIGKHLQGLSVGAAGLLTAMGAITKKSASLGAEIDDLSLQFGVSAETIQEWQYLAVQCGVDADVFTKSLVKMRAAMTDLSTGTANNATKALQELGIKPNQFKTQEQMFDGIVAALADVKDATLQTAYANEIFGDKIATQMLPYINTGAEAIKKFKDEFAAMPSLSDDQVTALAELDDTYYRLTVSLKNATAQLGVAFAPVMEKIVTIVEEKIIPAITKLADWFDGLSPGMQNFIVNLTMITALASPVFKAVGKITSVIGSLIKNLSSLNIAQIKTAAGFAAFAGAAALVFDLLINWNDMSSIEKGFKIVAAAALAAAAAFAVFHSAWSIGFAVAGIIAAIVGSLAAINSAKDSILPEMDDFTSDNIGGYTSYNPEDYTIPKPNGGGGNSYNDTSYNDQYNITINVTEPGASAEEIAAAVSREIATLAQSRG